MADPKKSCTNLLKSLAWCQGAPVRPGIRKRVYYTTTNNIVKWPARQLDEMGRPTSAVLQGNFVLAEGVKWNYIDHLPSKAEFKSEVQGEVPSQTFKETVTVVHPGTGRDAALATASLLNVDAVFLVEDIDGSFRVVGSEEYSAVATSQRDNGQGATGTAGTTITLEASDFIDCPFYEGTIETEDGTINDAAGA